MAVEPLLIILRNEREDYILFGKDKLDHRYEIRKPRSRKEVYEDWKNGYKN